MVQSASDFFTDKFTTNAINLTRFEGHVGRQIAGLYEQLLDELEGDIRRADIESIQRTRFRIARQEALLKQTRDTINQGYSRMRGGLKTELVSLAPQQFEFAQGAFNEVFKVDVMNVVMTPATARALVKSSLIDGNPLSKYWSKQSQNFKDSFSQQLNLGVMQGQTNDELIGRIIGKAGPRQTVIINGKTKIIRPRKGGIADVSRNHAETLVRTSVQGISNQSHAEVYNENEDLVKGRQALATLDTKTSLICIARAGSSWDMEGNPLPGSPRQDERYPGEPPWHPRCRTVIIALLYEWEELIERASGKKLKLIEKTPVDARASMDGETAEKIGFQKWLPKQSRTRKLKLLGKQRLELWENGDISLAQLIDQSGRPLTVEQLRAL